MPIQAIQSPSHSIASLCFHCGAGCDSFGHLFRGKNFCCDGCVAVYQLLHEKDLSDQYYRPAFAPGLKPSIADSSKFAYLDSPEITDKAVRKISDSLALVRLSVPQIHCSSCIWLLEHLGKFDSGILQPRVNRATRELSVRFDTTRTSLRGIVELLTRLGYEPEITYGSFDAEMPRNVSNRRLIRQIAVAGFAFVNVMLLSLPDYFSGGEIGDGNLTTTFRYFSLFLALPVIIYSASGYFIKSWHGLRQSRVSIDLPIALGIGMLFGRSSYDILSGTGSGYLDSFTGLVFFLLLGQLLQRRTFSKLSFDRDFRSFLPIAVLREDISSGVVTTVPLTQLQKGDHIFVRNNEVVPADGIVLSDTAMIDYSFVTGESQPQMRRRGDEIFAGGRIVGERVSLQVSKPVPESMLASLWSDRPERTTGQNLQSLADRMALPFTLSVIALALVTGWYWGVHDSSRMWLAMTSVLIVACPCALAIAGPFALATAARSWGERGLFVRTPSVIEAMSHTQEVVLDKTGTLTNPDSVSIHNVGNPDPLHLAVIASLADHSTHPVSRGLAQHLRHHTRQSVHLVREIAGSGLVGMVNQHEVRIGTKSFCGGAITQSSIGEPSDSSHVHASIDGEIVATFEIQPRYRDGVLGAIQRLGTSYRVTVMTGDSAEPDKLLLDALPKSSTVRVQCTPREKMSYVESSEAKSAGVLMVGDGLNDAGALQAANVGIAVCDKSAAFTPACDAIMAADQVAHLPVFLSQARSLRTVLKLSYAFALFYNVIGLSFASSGSLSPMISAILMPISSISVVGLAVLMTRFSVRRSAAVV